MMSVLKPIAFDVTLCMSQLFDYYLYTVSNSIAIWFHHLRPKKIIISFSGTASLHLHVPHLSFYSVNY